MSHGVVLLHPDLPAIPYISMSPASCQNKHSGGHRKGEIRELINTVGLGFFLNWYLCSTM